MNITAFCQQSRTVTGKVTDLKDGAPLAGVTVKAKGQTQVTSTGADGTFTITIPDATQALQFSYIGYGDLEVPVSEKMAVIMSASEKSLNEVVVVGYGTATKKNVSGSISKVSGKEIANFPTPSFESASLNITGVISNFLNRSIISVLAVATNLSGKKSRFPIITAMTAFDLLFIFFACDDQFNFVIVKYCFVFFFDA